MTAVQTRNSKELEHVLTELEKNDECTYRGFFICKACSEMAPNGEVLECRDGRQGHSFIFSNRLHEILVAIDDVLDNGLKPYRWYPQSLFDSNPKKYAVITRNRGELDPNFYRAEGDGCENLDSFCTHFMYIEPCPFTGDDISPEPRFYE